MPSRPSKKIKLNYKPKQPSPRKTAPKVRGRGLFTLDLDLRMHIYDLALGGNCAGGTLITLQNRFAACKDVQAVSRLTSSPRRYLGVLGVCRQLRQEATKVAARNVRLVVDHVVCDCVLCGGYFEKKCYAWLLNRDVLEEVFLPNVKVLEVMTCEDCVVMRRKQPLLPSDMPMLEKLVLHEDCLVYLDLVKGTCREKDVVGKLRTTKKYNGQLVAWVSDRINFFEMYKDLMIEVKERKVGSNFRVIVKVQALVRHLVPETGQFRFYFMRFEIDWDSRKILSRKGKDITASRPDFDCQYKHNVDNGDGIDNKHGCHGRAILPQDHNMEDLPTLRGSLST